MDYKDTLNLAATDFPMRGNLPQNEGAIYQKWDENDAFLAMQKRRENAPRFTLHDGPPYANGHLHIGHALNKILKDIVVKFHYFGGKMPHFTPGWDCHGLPIEQKIGSEKKNAMPKSAFRSLCRAHAGEFVAIQSREFRALGVLGDFKTPYITMDYAFEASIFGALCEIAKKGILVQRHKPIYWSWACQTALAEAEVEYQNKISNSIFVAFPLQNDALNAIAAATKTPAAKISAANLVIWTTTPWTLPANVAIALSPNERYVLTQNALIVAQKRYEALRESLRLGEILCEFDARILENLAATNPLNGRDSRIVLGEHVSMEDGSGAVHTAPGHGEEDYRVGLKYDLVTIMPVDDFGRFGDLVVKENLVPREFAGDFVGKNVFACEDLIMRILGDSLLLAEKITHSYPHCWRSHKPVIYRATTQWFILMDKPFCGGKTLRQIALEEIEKINFYPKSGYKRLKSMIENRPDWCISRQRAWGVPIAFFHDKDSGEALFDEALFSHLREIFAKEGLDCWWDKSIEELLPQSHKHRAVGLSKGEHILDVWFDSGSTWSAVLDAKNYNAGDYPADVYLEGSDQHRGWFQSSLLISCALNAKAPFKNIITHGFTVDDNGDKMSKSRGNVVLPEAVLHEYGSEILRLWVAVSDYQSDLKISPNILKQVAEQYRKIRNTLRFLLANTSDLDALVGRDSLGEIDRWVLQKALGVCAEATRLFGDYEFAKGFGVILGFVSGELSGVYVDLCKDVLYCDSPDSPRRRAIQSVLCVVTKKLCVLLAPFLTYTIDEVLRYAASPVRGEWESVFDVGDFEVDFALERSVDFEALLGLRDAFSVELDRLKKAGAIKNSLELEIAVAGKLDKNAQEILEKWLIVSGVRGENGVNLGVESCSEKSSVGESGGCNNAANLATLSLGESTLFLRKSTRFKCPRCWRFAAAVEEGLCARCEGVVSGA